MLNQKLMKFACMSIPKPEDILVSFLTGMNFVASLLPIFLLSRTTIVTSCTASYSVQGQVLQNHTFKPETAERIRDGMMLCTTNPGCHSSNFYRIDKRCEFNDKTHASHPEHMVHVPSRWAFCLRVRDRTDDRTQSGAILYGSAR